MKKILLAAFVMLAPYVFASSASAAGGQFGDACDVLPCDTAAGYTCDAIQICEYTGINTNINVDTGAGGTQTPLNQTNLGQGPVVPSIQQNLNSQTTNGSSGFIPLAPIPGLTVNKNGNYFTSTPNIPIFLNNLYAYLIGLAAALAVIYIIWGGLEISTQDSVSKQSDGRKKIENAVFGLVLVLVPALVFGIINPAILNLSLNLPPLNTTSGTTPPAGTQSPPITTDKNGVQISGNDYYRTYTYTNESQVTQYESACTTPYTWTSQSTCPSGQYTGSGISKTCTSPALSATCVKHDSVLYTIFIQQGVLTLPHYTIDPASQDEVHVMQQACSQAGVSWQPGGFSRADFASAYVGNVFGFGCGSLKQDVNVMAQDLGTTPDKVEYACTTRDTYCGNQ